jgi:hypothetical protein
MTAFVLSMPKMRAVGRRFMRCHCDAAFEYKTENKDVLQNYPFSTRGKKR